MPRFDKEKALAWMIKHVKLQAPSAIGKVHFVPKKIQREIMEKSSALAGEATVTGLVKPRQVGGSAVVMAYFSALADLYPGIQMIAILPGEEEAATLREKWQIMQEGISESRGHGLHEREDNVGKYRWTNGSSLAWYTVGGSEATSKKTGRGGSYAIAWFCEMAFPTEARFMSMAWGALRPALQKAGASIIIDSTPNGPTGPGATYASAIKMIYEKKLPGEVLFWPWWEDSANRVALPTSPAIFAASLTEEERGLSKRFGLSLKQIQFRREGMIGDPGTPEGSRRRAFLDKYPEREEDVFVHAESGNLFSGELMASLRERASTGWEDPLTRSDLAALEIGFGDSHLDLMFKSDVGILPDTTGYIRAYSLPSPGVRYFIGCDCSDGNPGSDWLSAVLVDEFGTMAAKVMLRVSPDRFAAVVQRLATHFNQAWVDIELQSGALVFDRLKRGIPVGSLGGEVFPEELDILAKPYPRARTVATTSTNRPNIVDAAFSIITRGQAVRDDTSLSEIENLMRDASGKIRARGNGHDDFFMACGIAESARRERLLRGGGKRPGTPRAGGHVRGGRPTSKWGESNKSGRGRR